MKWIAALVLTLLPVLASAQLFDFRRDLAFSEQEVVRASEATYRARIETLRGAGALDHDPTLASRIQAILVRLVSAAEAERPGTARLPWEIHISDAPGDNATAMAGGKLLVSAPFVRSLELDDDELACVLAHEVAHVVAEHARESATAALAFVPKRHYRSYVDVQDELDSSFSLALKLQHVQAAQELEADFIGVVLAARAGYEPAAMLSLLQKLGEDDGASVVRTHAPASERLAQARRTLPIARRVRLSTPQP
jgi:predicted Zn-dependent protease